MKEARTLKIKTKQENKLEESNLNGNVEGILENPCEIFLK
jgi:hypothetical protein